jgi:hypothetical protein
MEQAVATCGEYPPLYDMTLSRTSSLPSALKSVRKAFIACTGALEIWKEAYKDAHQFASFSYLWRELEGENNENWLAVLTLQKRITRIPRFIRNLISPVCLVDEKGFERDPPRKTDRFNHRANLPKKRNIWVLEWWIPYLRDLMS